MNILIDIIKKIKSVLFIFMILNLFIIILTLVCTVSIIISTGDFWFIRLSEYGWPPF